MMEKDTLNNDIRHHVTALLLLVVIATTGVLF
jgi:hypothetical protein